MPDSNSSSISDRLGLGYRVGLVTLGITALFVLLIAVIGTWLSFRDGNKRITENIHDITHGHLPGINSAVWELAENRIDAELKVIYSIPYVMGVRVHSGPHDYQMGNLDSDRVESFALHHPSEGDFGLVEVAFDMSALRADVLSESIENVFYMVIPFLILALSFLIIFNKMVTKHIRGIAGYARNLDLDSLDQTFQYRRSRASKEGGDELDLLLASINTMRRTLLEQIAERQLVERRLGESEQDYQQVFNSIGEALFIHDAQTGRIIETNQVACSLYRCTSEDFKHLGVNDLSLGEPPYSEAEALTYIKKATEEGPQLFEWRARRVDGELFWAEIFLRKGVLRGAPCVLATVRDATERRAAEEQLIQLQKMDSIGQLAGGIAHDFNNMLGGIIGGAELLQLLHKDDKKSQEYIHLVLQAARRAAELTGKMLAFSRKGVRERTQLHLHEVIRDACDIIERTIDRRIDLEIHLDANSDGLVGDRTLMQNAVMNLCINAADAMPDGGCLAIATSNLGINEEAAAASPFELQPGLYVELQISDTGIGIPENIRQYIFEPFFTTKEVGRGTGMGLAAVYGTVSDHGGSITVTSDVGVGTVFSILLPVDQTEVNISAIMPSGETPHGEGTILLVDDEALIRTSVKHMLEVLGYQVILASDGEEGVAMYEKHLDTIDVVVLDMIMPKLNGSDCFYTMKAMREDVPIILSSGFAANDMVQDLQANGLFAYLKKPIRLHELAQALNRALKSDD